jgi:hemin uptake protein HemP
VRPLPATPEKLPPPRPCKRVNSKQLLADEREIEIEHVGQLYRLRITALGKLILTK